MNFGDTWIGRDLAIAVTVALINLPAIGLNHYAVVIHCPDEPARVGTHIFISRTSLYWSLVS